MSENKKVSQLPTVSTPALADFMYLAQYGQKEALLREMVRLSRRYVLFVAVNKFNPGFLSPLRQGSSSWR